MISSLITSKSSSKSGIEIQMIPYLVAVLGGVFIACQAVVNANVARLVGSIPLAGLVSVIVTFAALLVAVISAGYPHQALRGLANTPYWMPVAGGLLGAGIMGAVLWATPRIGAGSIVVLLVAGQLIFAAMADHFGLFGLQTQRLGATRVAGLLAVTFGAWLVSIR